MVNSALIRLYWQLGNDILEKQEQQGWGAKVIDRLSKDLKQAFPEIKGFSRTNLKYMRSLAQTYNQAEIRQQAVDQLPWGHNIVLLTKLKHPETRRWHVQKTLENGWSRNILVHQIESQLYQRQGSAITNFEQTLCKTKQKTTAEYALRNLNTLIGVATHQLPQQLAHNCLPLSSLNSS